LESLCALYGYRRIQTPVFEDTELFARTSGAGSDVVQKEMYSFEDRAGRSLTLRPEGTAPIVRAYLEHGLHREPQPQKLFTISTTRRARSGPRRRCASSTSRASESRPPSSMRPRSANRSAKPAGSTSTPFGAISTPTASRTS